MPKFRLKKQIREEFRAAVPSRAPKLDLEELLPDAPKRRVFSFARVTAVMTLFAVVLLSAVFAGWIPIGQTTTTTTTTSDWTSSDTTTTDTTTTDTSTTSSSTTTTTTTTTDAIVLPVDETTLANPLITAANLTFSMNFGGATQLANRLSDPVFLVDGHLDWIHRYVGALETALSGSGGYVAVALESDRETYSHRLSSTVVTLSGAELVYNLYYNILDAKDNKYDIAGIVVRDGVEHPFVGSLKTDETETKWTIVSYGSEDPEDNYVETKMKLEEDSQKIETRIVENGETVHESLIKIEVEQNEAKIVVETVSQDESIVFDIKWETEDGESQLKGSYSIDGLDWDEQGEFAIALFVDPLDGETYYRYTITSGSDTKVVDKAQLVAWGFDPKDGLFL